MQKEDSTGAKLFAVHTAMCYTTLGLELTHTPFDCVVSAARPVTARNDKGGGRKNS